jgi:hypothetical protein
MVAELPGDWLKLSMAAVASPPARMLTQSAVIIASR